VKLGPSFGAFSNCERILGSCIPHLCAGPLVNTAAGATDGDLFYSSFLGDSKVVTARYGPPTFI
jgi:hypothetical protein